MAKKEMKGFDEDVAVPDKGGVKSYEEKLADLKQYHDEVGLSDPTTLAKEAQMELAPSRGRNVDRIFEERNEARAARSEAYRAEKAPLVANNEMLSAKLRGDKVQDIKASKNK